MTPQETTTLIDAHLTGWLGGDHESPTLRTRIAAMIAEAEKKRDELWRDGNITLDHERDTLARWKQDALTIESWWQKIDAFVRAHPDCRLGYHVSDEALRLLKDRDTLKTQLAAMQQSRDDAVQAAHLIAEELAEAKAEIERYENEPHK